MYLHVTFVDGSNPWIMYTDDKKQIAKKARYFWEKYGCGAYITINGDGTKQPITSGGGYWRAGRNMYKYIGHALQHNTTK